MYKIIGADGRQYGPVTAEQLRQWIVEGRANAQTYVLAAGATEWKPVNAVPEFVDSFPIAVPPPLAPLAAGSARKIHGFATAGFVLSLVSWVFCCCYGLPFNILGCVFSVLALVQINRQPELHEGRGLAIAGIVLSVTSILVYIVLAIIGLSNSHYNWKFNQFGQ